MFYLLNCCFILASSGQPKLKPWKPLESMSKSTHISRNAVWGGIHKHNERATSGSGCVSQLTKFATESLKKPEQRDLVITNDNQILGYVF